MLAKDVLANQLRHRLPRGVGMLTALVLVCSLDTTPLLADCDRDNAIHVMAVPGVFVSPITCFLHGQAHLAGTAIGRDLFPNERVKVICAPLGAAQGQPAAATAQ
jgi:hypothetical protein